MSEPCYIRTDTIIRLVEEASFQPGAPAPKGQRKTDPFVVSVSALKAIVEAVREEAD